MSDYRTLREANAARQLEWDPEGWASNEDWRINELAGEVGEVCNVLKKLHRERYDVRGSRSSVAALGEELADVAICIDLTAMQRGLDPVVGRANEMSRRPSAWPLPLVGRKLIQAMGRAADPLHSTAYPLELLLGIVEVISWAENIDLQAEIVAKFNKTSAANNLATRLIANQ